MFPLLQPRQLSHRVKAESCNWQDFCAAVLLLAMAWACVFSALPASAKEDGASAEGQKETEKPSASGKEESKPQADGAARSDPNDKRPYAEEAIKHYNRGVELHQQAFYNQAIEEYKAAIQADERMAEAYSNLATIYASQKNFTKASDAFTKALSLAPDKPTTLNAFAAMLYQRKKVDEAKEKWKRAVEVDPRFSAAYYNLGNALESESDTRGAIALYLKAIDSDPGRGDAYFRIGSILHKDKHPAQAHVFLTRAIELAPDADYVATARKQLSELQAELNREGGSTSADLPMNVMTPPTRAASAPPPESKEKTEPKEEEKTTRAPGKIRLLPTFRFKPKKDKKVDMFLHSGDQGASGTKLEQDLKPEPGS